jgi:hypothetical protein
MIGPKCGDDGLARASIQKSINKSARAYGLELKVERYNPEIGLCFLSRVFIDPLSTNTTMQDPLRTLRKLHLTTRDPTIPLADAACDRVDGYLCTDAITPLISDYCKMVLRLYEPKSSSLEIRNKRRSRNREKPYWLTCDGSWPQHPQDIPAMKQILINRTGIDEDQVDKLIGRFTAMVDVWEPFTYDTENNGAAHTIDEEGIVPGSVDESFTKLNEAKQARANAGNSRTKHKSDNGPKEQPRTTKGGSPKMETFNGKSHKAHCSPTYRQGQNMAGERSPRLSPGSVGGLRTCYNTTKPSRNQVSRSGSQTNNNGIQPGYSKNSNVQATKASNTKVRVK